MQLSPTTRTSSGLLFRSQVFGVFTLNVIRLALVDAVAHELQLDTDLGQRHLARLQVVPAQQPADRRRICSKSAYSENFGSRYSIAGMGTFGTSACDADVRPKSAPPGTVVKVNPGSSRWSNW